MPEPAARHEGQGLQPDLARGGLPVILGAHRGVEDVREWLFMSALAQRGEFRGTCKSPADRSQPGEVERTVEVPPEGFEPSHLAPEASALSPELWGLANGERLPVHSGDCDTRAVDDHAP